MWWGLMCTYGTDTLCTLDIQALLAHIIRYTVLSQYFQFSTTVNDTTHYAVRRAWFKNTIKNIVGW